MAWLVNLDVVIDAFVSILPKGANWAIKTTTIVAIKNYAKSLEFNASMLWTSAVKLFNL